MYGLKVMSRTVGVGDFLKATLFFSYDCSCSKAPTLSFTLFPHWNN